MTSRNPGTEMLAEALELLRQADRLHRQFCDLHQAAGGGPCWEPPIDIIENERAIIILVALPGVAPDAVKVVTDGASVRIVAERHMPAGPEDFIHRIEIPQGRFERRIELPPGRYDVAGSEIANGCLVLTLAKLI
ncbi:MAG TPA: Hsp20/alpha crystallin family protein [Gammaproteobacteria bacterium]|nr:Hsp20/alpha crystallin family protein [Gammaproteobacteria bacterium]